MRPIAQQISHACGVAVDNDVVRHVRAKHYRPGDPGTNGRSWLTFIGHVTDSPWSVDLFRRWRANLRIIPTARACCASPLCLDGALSRSVSHTDSSLSTKPPPSGC